MKQQTEQGLTLIEVLVSLAIFAIVSVAVLAMFPTIFKLNSKTRADQAVTISAKQFMEGVRVNYSTTSGFNTETLPATPNVSNYTCASTVDSQPVASVPAGYIKRVTLSCTSSTQPPQTFVLDLGRPES